MTKWHQILKLFELIWKVHPTKRENPFQNLDHISFVTWGATETQFFEFLIYIWPVWRLINWNFVVKLSQSGPKIKILCVGIEVFLKKFRKKIQKLTENCHSQCVEDQRYFRGNQRWNGAVQHWFLAVKFFVFSAVQRFSPNEQHWIRTEIFMNHSWSALTLCQTSNWFEFNYQQSVTAICNRMLKLTVNSCIKKPKHVILVWWNPGLENMAATPWSYHDHGETWSWSCHDDGMVIMFLGEVVMIYGMIMVWLPCFP